MWPLLTLLACGPDAPSGPAAPKAALPPEADLPHHPEGAWPLSGGRGLRLAGGALLLDAGGATEVLAVEVVGLPAVAGDRVAVSHRAVAEGVSAIELLDLGPLPSRRRLTAEGAPDRVALSEDGARVAWVSGATGLASIWAAPWSGGPPVQLTNRGVAPTPGEAPPGFVPPPHEGPPAWVGRRLVWDSPEGHHEVERPW